MTETQHISPRKVAIRERCALVGNNIFVNGHRVNRTLLKKRFAEGGYEVKETPHFLLSTRSEAPSTILVHFFALEELNTDIKHYLMIELKPLGLLYHGEDYGKIFAEIGRLQSHLNLVCRLLLEKKKQCRMKPHTHTVSTT